MLHDRNSETSRYFNPFEGDLLQYMSAVESREARAVSEASSNTCAFTRSADTEKEGILYDTIERTGGTHEEHPLSQNTLHSDVFDCSAFHVTGTSFCTQCYSSNCDQNNTLSSSFATARDVD